MTLTRLASGNPQSRSLVDAACVITGDWREVAEADDLDGVIIATPPALHAGMTRAALKAGLPVLVEKPLTMDLGEARELLAFAEKQGGFVLVDHIHIFSAAWGALKREAGNHGPVRAIDAVAGNWGPFRSDVPVLWDWGPHDFAMCCDLLRRPAEAVSVKQVETRRKQEGFAEILDLEAGFGNGILARITFGNLMTERKRHFRVHFDTCSLVYDDMAAAKLMRHPAPNGLGKPLGPGEPLPVDGDPPMNRLLFAFARAIREGSRALASLRLGVRVVEALTRAQQILDEPVRTNRSCVE